MSRGFNEEMRVAREQIAAYLKKYNDRPKTAKTFGVSLSYVDQTARMFGLAPPQLNLKRMIKVMHSLIHTDLSITDIADKVKLSVSSVAGIYRMLKKSFPEMPRRKRGRPKKM